MVEINKTGRLIEQMRREKNMTQAELADAVGVSKQAVSNWERGKRFPDVSLIEALSKTLGVSAAELIKGERIPESNVKEPEVTQLVFDALKVHKRELDRRWRLITLIFVALTAMLCLAWDYAFFFDKLILLNFGVWSAFAMLIAVVFGCAVRYFSVDKESFYKTALSAMAAWIVCEAFAAIGFKNDLMSVIGLVTFAAEMAWYILCALAGAWATHAVMRGFKRPIAKGRGENESR